MSRTIATNPIAVLVPVHNEQDCIWQTLESINRQTLRPGFICVVLNNSTDNTRLIIEQYAKAHPEANVWLAVMPHNPHKKAGALNFGYKLIRSRRPQVRFIVQMDGDSILDSRFIELTFGAMQRRTHCGAVSSAFVGRFGLARTKWQRALMVPQRMEYTRYQDSMQSTNVTVISGTGNMLRVDALDELLKDPARNGEIWRTDTLVEDYELSLALRHNDWTCRKSKAFVVYTDLMPTVRALWRQRLRWQRGTIDELRRYGWTEHTRGDWLKQITHGVLMMLHIAGVAFLGYVLYDAWANDRQLSLHWAVGLFLAVIAIKQAYHVRSLGWRHVLVSLTLVPEEMYNFLRHAWWLRGLWLSLRGVKQGW